MPARLATLAPLSLLVLTLACKPPTASEAPAAVAASTAEPEPPQPTGAPVSFASEGAPHSASISLIAPSPDGRAALTRDDVGGVRLWPALDGSHEPLLVPIRGPRSMALAGTAASGFTLSLIDPAGGVRLVGVNAAGEMEQLGSLPPMDPIVETLVLPGGEQLLAVGADHTLRLLDRRGSELARIDEAGLRIETLRLALDAPEGPRVVALTAAEFDDDARRFAIEAVSIELGAEPAQLGLGAARQRILMDAPPRRDNPSLSPDGRALVHIERRQSGVSVVATLLEDGRTTVVDSGVPNAGASHIPVNTRVGLLSGGRVLLDDGSGVGRVLDLADRRVTLVPLRSGPLDFQVSVYLPDLRLAPVVNWLAVHQLEDDALSYLGYEPVNVTDVGVSPTGSQVAWALADRVAVELAETHEVFEVPETRAHSYRFVDFLDDEHLLMLGYDGGLELVRWREGERVSAVDLGANVQSAQFARDPAHHGALLVRTHLWQNPVLVELLPRDIGPRYLTHGAGTFVGLLAPIDAQGQRDGSRWGGWTLDDSGARRVFLFSELAAKLGPDPRPGPGDPLDIGMPELITYGPDSARYWIRTENTRPVLHVDGKGPEPARHELSPGPVSQLAFSHDGRRLAIVQVRDPGQVLTIYDPADMRTLWAQPLQGVNGLAWSDTGEAVAVAANFGGGVLLDGESGAPLTARCGLAFRRLHAPPVVQALPSQLNVCEL